MTEHKKRKLRPWVRIVLTLSAIICVLQAGRTVLSFETAAQSAYGRTPKAMPEPSAVPLTHTLSLYMLGDALVQQPNVRDAQREDGSYDWAPQMDPIADPASNYDLAFYNQECILGGDELGITPFPHFNCPVSYGDYRISKGFNLVSVANNHSLDKEYEACVNSHNYWESHPEAVTSGMNLSPEERQAVPVHEKNGITYAFTAWTYDMNGWQPPEGKDYLINKYRGS